MHLIQVNTPVKEFWPRRIIWTATLKPEADVWEDLIQAERATALSVAPIIMTLSENPPEDFNGIPEDYIFSLGIENSGGQVHVDWYGMRGFSYQLQGIDNLLYSAYSGFENMGGPYTGGDTGIVVDVSQSPNYFFKIAATALDEDMDGLPDCWEFLYFGDINLYGALDDPDLDGLTNARELETATHPEKLDTDDDGMWDNFEVYYAFDPLNGAASQPGNMGPEDDWDFDGISNLNEHNQGTFPDRSDFNLSETNDVVKWFGQSDWRYQLQGSATNLVPGNWIDLGVSLLGENREIRVDVSQYTQAYFRVEVSGYDSDGDGLVNALEREKGTDPYNPDTDDDGMWDNFEVYYDFDPLNGAAFQTGGMGPKDDFDGDGISNINEYNQGTFPDRSDFSLSETNNIAEWFGQFGWHYQLQGATSLVTSNWVDLGTSRAGENKVFSVDVGSYAKPYLRVEVSGIDLLQEGSYTSRTEVVYGSTSQFGRYAEWNLTSGYAIDRKVNIATLFNNITDHPINGRLIIPKDPQEMDAGEKFPLAIIVHGKSGVSYSEDGYIYLCEHLASHGIMTATIDENDFNGNGVAGENDARAVVLLEHVKQFGLWNSDTNHPLHHRVDMDKIMLIGHSRGGEAVEYASYLNQVVGEDPITHINFDTGFSGTQDLGLGPYHFNLDALVAIAPTEGQYIAVEDYEPVYITVPINDNYLIMHGSRDGDVFDFQGYRTYDRAHQIDVSNPSADAEGSKALVWIHGANHNYFNTVWGSEASALMTAEEQRKIAKYYIASFAYSKIFDCTWALNDFRDNRCGNTNFPSQVQVTTQYQDEKRSFIAHYEEDDVTQTPSVPGTNSVSGSCTLQESNFLNIDEFGYPTGRDMTFSTNNAADVAWTDTGSYEVDVASPMNVAPYSMLTFRIFKTAAPSSGDIAVELKIQDASGTNQTFSISDYASIWNPDGTSYQYFCNGWVMQTVSIPLADINAAGIDLSAVKKITLEFSDQCTGQVYMDDLQFSE